MNRSKYFEYIEDKLATLAFRIERKGKLNILDLHLHSENFYMHFFNKLFGWNLYNMNDKLQNVEAIDLIDDTNKLLIQVSATATKDKIEKALKKEIIKKYADYTFLFISISKNASDLRTKIYKNPHNLTFNPATNIYDTNSIQNKILSLEIETQKRIFHFIKNELGNEVDAVKLDSNLASVINILAKENFSSEEILNKKISFEIDRKISHNNLDTAKYIIEDYKIYHNKVDKQYSEFDKFGSNKSKSVLDNIRKEYLKLIKITSDDELFFKIIENVITKIIESKNFIQIPIDELELCVNILVVDAFIRCKIFINPENYNYATT